MRKLLFTTITVAICLNAYIAIADENISEAEKSAHMAHQNYVDAINSNNLDSLLGMLTEDVVFMSAGDPVMVGKEAVKPWVAGYYEAFHTNWEKTVEEFVVQGEWAFERYSAINRDSSLTDGQIFTGTSWGLAIYHYDADGKWRIARDAWGSDTK